MSEAQVDLQSAELRELLALHAAIGEELRRRGVLRSANNPTGDLAEYLFCKAFGWSQERNSHKSFDALDADGRRYQIKGLRLLRPNQSRQMSAIRDFNGFDVLAAVILDRDYRVWRAALIPAAVAQARAPHVGHTNSYKFLLRDDVWTIPGVMDVTARLRAAEA